MTRARYHHVIRYTIAVLCFLVFAGCARGPRYDPEASLDYACPMDPDIRARTPGNCPRCGMVLRLGIPDPVEYPLELKLTPTLPCAGAPTELLFKVTDPQSGAPVKQFEIVHEKLFHMFVVSQDLKYFLHDHPASQSDGTFKYTVILPKPGLYRVVGDFYPSTGTPQLIPRTIIIAGGDLETAQLAPDLTAKHAENMDVELTMEPRQAIAGATTRMFFRIEPDEGFEKYLGAWAHMFIASDDLIDLIHDHPFVAGTLVQFNLIFPRARTYRMWVQFQRKGVVNTVAFNIPVSKLK